MRRFRPTLSTLAALVLAALLALTSVGAALARGAMAAGGSADLCSGQGLAAPWPVAPDWPGNRAVHDCLDCLAPLALAGAARPALPEPQARLLALSGAAPQADQRAGQAAPPVLARGPPDAV
jgi:hypothetical protein